MSTESPESTRPQPSNEAPTPDATGTPPAPPGTTPDTAPDTAPVTAPEDAAPDTAPDGAPPRDKPKLDAETEAEIDAAMAELGLAAGLTDHHPGGGHHRPRHTPQERHHAAEAPTGGAAKPKVRGPRVVEGGREHRTGMVVSVGATDIFVEFGPKELGVVELRQYEGVDPPKVGQELEVVVQRYEPTESIYICARPGTVQKADWEMLEAGQTVEVRVTGVNKGGLECEVAGHHAFMPASQVDINHIPDLSVFVGEKLPCVVQRVDKRGKGNIVLSRREVIERERAEAAKGLQEALHEGDTLEGVVRKIMDFGAFIDLGGVDGLVHLNDLSHERVNHGAKNVARHVSEGQKVKVQILKLDWDANRISLGMKQLQADPFAAAASEVVEGAQMTGKVVKIAEFGAFVEVAPGVEGLVHISELEWRRVGKVEEVVQEGEVVQVKVLKVDPDSRKVSLSIKQTKEPPQREGTPGRGRGRGRGDRDDRDPSEILKETPQLRRMREQAKLREKEQGKKKGGGLGESGGLGMGLGDLKL